MSAHPLSYESAVARVREFQDHARKQANFPTEQDPNQQGTVTAKERSDETPSALGLPVNRKPLTNALPNGTESALNPGPTGTNVPNTVDGQPKDDAANSPTTPLSKIARNAAAAAQRIRNLQGAPAAVKAASEQATNDHVASDINLNVDMLVKLAATLIESEDGVRLAEAVLIKSAGAEAARNLINAAQAQYDGCAREAAYYDEQVKSAAYFEQEQMAIADEMLKSASPDEQAQIVKIASVHQAVLGSLSSELEQQAYKQGAMDAAAMMDSQGAPAAGADPAEGGPEEPQLPGGEDGPASLEQIAQLISAAVQSGEIDQETAEQILTELAQGGHGGEEEGDAPPMGGPGASPEEEIKAANYLFMHLAQ